MNLPSLHIAPGKRYFTTSAGQPFFYLGDTAWELFHRLDREEAEFYLTARAAAGFNVIQAVALAERDGLRTPNRYGHCPFVDLDPLRPDEQYWQHVDWIIDRANQSGLYVGLLPTWGDKWNCEWGVGPEIFTLDNARAYGRWIGRRYRDAALIWIMGGDRRMRHEGDLQVIRAMAEGLREGDDRGHLMTFHPAGARSSSLCVHAEPWLDFHLMQTGHGRNDSSLRLAAHDWELQPRRPFVNGEPSYEEIPEDFRNGDSGWIDQHDIRREFYWMLCSGAAGYTYGAHPIWQFYTTDHVPPLTPPRLSWQQAMTLPGAAQLQRGLRLLQSLPAADREPAGGWIRTPSSSGIASISACRGGDASWALLYLPLGQRVTVDLNLLRADWIRAVFCDPVTGAMTPAEIVNGHQEVCFSPALLPCANADRLLLLCDADRDFTFPD